MLKKKALALLVGMSMVAAMTAGCGGSKETAATEKATEKKTEVATEKATEKETEAATEKETEAATEAATEKETEVVGTRGDNRAGSRCCCRRGKRGSDRDSCHGRSNRS